MRLHSPFEEFLLSYADIKHLFEKDAEWIKPLTLKQFFNLKRLAAAGGVGAMVARMANLVEDVMPASLRGSALSPYVVALVRKRSH